MYRDFKTTLELVVTVLDNKSLTSEQLRKRFGNMPDRTFKRHMATARKHGAQMECATDARGRYVWSCRNKVMIEQRVRTWLLFEQERTLVGDSQLDLLHQAL
ncbi:hypothetical protein LPB19_11900 [Marinobacter salinisoli]|uniref:WYL domain-containing protein n=1 Tax=Marinobacter salinisoli TaxID=2769486 RepID=A0ABX7MS20_9GAMM|nr:hypothetical protein [Marinobacter salinisoli]QSP93896.1 hypothetical protein LPB19_11900 [Marinobacter salinisoli]